MKKVTIERAVELFKKDISVLENHAIKFNKKLAETIHDGVLVLVAGGAVEEIIDEYRRLVKNDLMSQGTFKIIRSTFNKVVEIMINLTKKEQLELYENIKAIGSYRKIYEYVKAYGATEAEAEVAETETTEAEVAETETTEAEVAETETTEAEVTIDDILDLLDQIEEKAVELPAYKLVTLKSMLENLIKAL